MYIGVCDLTPRVMFALELPLYGTQAYFIVQITTLLNSCPYNNLVSCNNGEKLLPANFHMSNAIVTFNVMIPATCTFVTILSCTWNNPWNFLGSCSLFSLVEPVK